MLVFRFAQQVAAQAIDIVPAGTTNLRFDFFSTEVASANSLLFSETRAFATTVTFTDVPASTRSVLVTAFGSDGFPLVTLTSTIVLDSGESTEVDLNEAQPVTLTSLEASPEVVILAQGESQQISLTAEFSNGSTVAIPSSRASFAFQGSNGGANVSSTGLLSFLEAPGTSTLVSSFTFGGVTVTDTSLVRVVYFEAGNLDSTPLTRNSTYVGSWDHYFTDSNGSTQSLGGTGGLLSFALRNAPSGITINPATGEMTIASNAAQGAFEVVVTWIDPRPSSDPLATGRTFEDGIPFVLGPPQI